MLVILCIDLSGKIFRQRNSIPKDLGAIKIADVLRKCKLFVVISFLKTKSQFEFKSSHCFFLCLSGFYSKAQTDSTKIKSYADQVMIRVNFDTNIENYTFSEGGEENLNQTILSINNKRKASLSIDYRIISATLSFTPRFFPRK